MAKTLTGIGATATDIHNTDTLFVCTYHQTEVVHYDKEGKLLTLRNGGYQTATTKRRINECMKFLGLPVHVFQEGGIWFAQVDGFENGTKHPFADGMMLYV